MSQRKVYCENLVIRKGVTAKVFGRAVPEFSLNQKLEVGEVIKLIAGYSRQLDVERIYWGYPEMNLRKLQVRYRYVHTNYFSPPTSESKVVREGPFSAVCITRPGIGVAMLARANPLLVLTHKGEGSVVVVNCKLDALHGIDYADPQRSVLDDVALQLPPSWFKDCGSDVCATFILGTAAEHYNLRHRGAESLGPELYKLWGKAAVPDLHKETVDLQELVVQQLAQKGLGNLEVNKSTIDVHDDQHFAASGKGVGHNLVIVVRER